MSGPARPATGLAAQYLPEPLGTDPVGRALAAAVDALFVPLLTLVDCVDGYVDPATAPPSMVELLGRTLGLDALLRPAPEDRRRVLRSAPEIIRWRGTRRGIRAALVAAFGTEDVDVSDTGRVTGSVRREPADSPEQEPQVAVTMPAEVLDRLGPDAVRAVIAAVTPPWVTIVLVYSPA